MAKKKIEKRTTYGRLKCPHCDKIIAVQCNPYDPELVEQENKFFGY